MPPRISSASAIPRATSMHCSSWRSTAPGEECSASHGIGDRHRRAATRPRHASSIIGERSTSGCGSGPDAKRHFRRSDSISPDYYCIDGTIPRRPLPECSRGSPSWPARTGCAVANVFHAGDGNLHPLILYDANRPGDSTRPRRSARRSCELCVAVGGIITGEHGVGVEKRDLMGEMFNDGGSRPSRAHQVRLRSRQAAQSGQGVSDPASLRRIRTHACAPRSGPVSWNSAILTHGAITALHAGDGGRSASKSLPRRLPTGAVWRYAPADRSGSCDSPIELGGRCST